MASEREALEQEEEALCRTLEAADDLLRAKLALQEALREGWFDLSRARYHMGPGAVGRTQYDANMTAHVRLTAEAAAGASPATWSLLRVDDAPGTPSELRQRARRSSVDAAAAGMETAQPASDAAPRASTAGSSGLPQAPLRWFSGAMPPPPLRSAQQHFFRALECVVDAANAHARLAGLPAAAAPARKEEEEATQAASGSDTDEGEDAPPRAAASSARMSEVDSLLSRLGMSDDGVTSALVLEK